MGHKKELTLIAQPEAFFHELVHDAVNDLRVQAAPETEFYLVNLLKQFMSTAQLYPQDTQTGENRDEALVHLFKEALEAQRIQERALLLRRLGDVSLYKAGYFQESLNRSLVDVDYYIDFGEKAYSQVATLTDTTARKLIYQELSEKFGAFVDVLASVSEKTTPSSNRNLIQQYELWLKTGSSKASRTLQNAGIPLSSSGSKKGKGQPH